MDTDSRPRVFADSIMTGHSAVRAAMDRGIERTDH
jgi:hypothetical protein